MGSSQRTHPEGIRITRVGFWFVVFVLVAAVAATNTGNNALYMVLAALLAVLVVSGLISRANLRRLEIRLEMPDEVFAKRPFQARFELENTSRRFSRWLIIFSISYARAHRFVPHLAAGKWAAGRIDMLIPERGLTVVRNAHLWSVFPLGFFRKGLRYPVDREVLVYPEVFRDATVVREYTARHGDEAASERGWGHELHSMREFRGGDDPRSIHWKRSASSGSLIYMEREAEEGRRLSIVFDNAVGTLQDDVAAERFEKLVSEAATVAYEYLQAGFEVELVTRQESLGFGSGPAHRRRLLEHLALVSSQPRQERSLHGSDPGVPEIRLALRNEEAA